MPPEWEKGGRDGGVDGKRTTKPSLFKNFIMASKTLDTYFKSENNNEGAVVGYRRQC